MALPIKDTPTLYGKDAKKFILRMQDPGKVSKKDYKRAEELYNKIKVKEITDAFAQIEKHDLKPTTIICTVCGNVVSDQMKESSPCEHLREMFKDII